MKKILTIIASLFVVFAATSCLKDEEKDYGFTIDYFSSFDKDTPDFSERYDKIVEAIEQVPYFKSHEYMYFGNRTEASKKASQEFVDNVNKLDEDAIEGKLNLGEVFGIMLYETTSGEIMAMIRWSPDPSQQ